MGAFYVREDVRYVHDQVVSLSPWVINHGLGMFPTVTIVDVGLNEIEADVVYVSLNRVDVNFAVPVAGKAFLS
jgi:hypothetical protein